MKTTGVVRRIDDLGRIVIPKDIRKSLRIRDGESLEFFVDKETITLKKFSTSANLCDVSQVLLDAICTTIDKSIFVTDRDFVLAGSGKLKKKMFGLNISSELEDYMFDNDGLYKGSGSLSNLIDTKESFDCKYILSPILVEGETIGLVILIADDSKTFVEEDEHLVQIITNFLSKYLED